MSEHYPEIKPMPVVREVHVYDVPVFNPSPDEDDGSSRKKTDRLAVRSGTYSFSSLYYEVDFSELWEHSNQYLRDGAVSTDLLDNEQESAIHKGIADLGEVVPASDIAELAGMLREQGIDRLEMLVNGGDSVGRIDDLDDAAYTYKALSDRKMEKLELLLKRPDTEAQLQLGLG